MKFVNLKTCDGIETFLYLDGGLLRLSLLPAKLRSLSQKELAQVVDELAKLGRNASREDGPQESGKASMSAGTEFSGEPARPVET